MNETIVNVLKISTFVIIYIIFQFMLKYFSFVFNHLKQIKVISKLYQ